MLETLRQPLESGRVTMARANVHVTSPHGAPALRRMRAAGRDRRKGSLMSSFDRLRRASLVALGVGALTTTAAAAATGAHQVSAHTRPHAEHVLLISVDGLHQSDLRWWVRHHPRSALARLARAGTEYGDAVTPVPSDSFPGMVAQVTGGDPRTTGIYYDDSLQPPAAAPGQRVHARADDRPRHRGELRREHRPQPELDRRRPRASRTSTRAFPAACSPCPATCQAIEAGMIDPAQLPIDPATCTPVYPRQYLRVNTVFQVAHDAGLRTAWADKHPAYELLAGHSGHGHRRPVHARDQQLHDRPEPARRARAGTGRRTTATPSSTTRSRCGPSSTRSTAATTPAPRTSASRRSSG